MNAIDLTMIEMKVIELDRQITDLLEQYFYNKDNPEDKKQIETEIKIANTKLNMWKSLLTQY